MALFKKKNKAKVETKESQPFSIEGDRATVNVGNKRSSKKFLKVVLFLIVVLLFFTIFFYVKFSKKQQEKIEVVEVENSQVDQFSKDQSFSDFFGDVKAKEEKKKNQTIATIKSDIETEVAEKESAKESEKENSFSLPVSEGKQTTKRGQKEAPTPEERRLMGSVLVDQKDISSTSQSNKSTKEKAEDNFLKSNASYKDGSVAVIHNLSFLLSAGTTIPCVLKTKIVTSYPAVVLCQTTKNIYSDDGKNILIRSGALVQGEQTKVIKQGIARVFVNWNTIKDGNLSVRVDGLGADSLGASGLPAWIDSHFWERFGGALMLSFIDDALAAAATHAQKSNDNVSVDNIRNTGSTMAEMALENSINITPTAYINQGSMLTIIVPRNTDFSHVYRN